MCVNVKNVVRWMDDFQHSMIKVEVCVSHKTEMLDPIYTIHIPYYNTRMEIVR